MTQFQTIVSGFIQHIEGISSEVEKEELKVSKVKYFWQLTGLWFNIASYIILFHTIIVIVT